MRAALVGAVDFNAVHFAGEEFDCIIAVDGGYAHLARLGVTPHLAVGDFDSLGFAPACPVRTFPVEKDASDMELALREAVARGCTEVLLYGAFARRLDHTLANLGVLMTAARAGIRAFGIADGCAVTLLCGSEGMGSAGACVPAQASAPAAWPDRLAFSGAALKAAGLAEEGHAHDPVRSPADLPPAPDPAVPADYGNFVSVFAWDGPARGVTLSGLKYELDGADLPSGSSLGLSNEFTGRDAHLRVVRGLVAVTFPLAAWPALPR